MEVLVDSHALFWYFEDPKKLPPKITKLLDTALIIVIPTIALLELEAILAKKLLKDRFKKLLYELVSNRSYLIFPLNLEVIKIYTGSDQNLEIHDKVIVSTAKLLGLPIVTKDRKITKTYPKVVWD